MAKQMHSIRMSYVTAAGPRLCNNLPFHLRDCGLSLLEFPGYWKCMFGCRSQHLVTYLRCSVLYERTYLLTYSCHVSETGCRTYRFDVSQSLSQLSLQLVTSVLHWRQFSLSDQISLLQSSNPFLLVFLLCLRLYTSTSNHPSATNWTKKNLVDSMWCHSITEMQYCLLLGTG